MTKNFGVRIDEVRKHIHPDLFSNFVDKKVVVPHDTNENQEVLTAIYKKLKSPAKLTLTINPTMDCNLKCWYCYETHKKGSFIKEEVIASIIKFVNNQVEENDELKTVELSFFGGEPLIRSQACALPLSSTISEICKKNMKEFNLHYTTNGTLLTKDVVNNIVKIAPNTTFQIAMDGNREKHNTVKHFPEIGTYDIVLSNINYALSKHLRINIRCNYGIDNVDSFAELADDLNDLPNMDKSLVSISFHKIWQDKASMSTYESANNISKIMVAKGFNCSMGDSACAPSFCYADHNYSYVINYNGDVFKCTARNFDSKQRMGVLNTSGNIDYEKDKQQFPYVLSKKECYECSLMPICTICSQTHIECNQSDKCPSNIPEEDKLKQIERRFKGIYSSYFKSENNYLT